MPLTFQEGPTYREAIDSRDPELQRHLEANVAEAARQIMEEEDRIISALFDKYAREAEAAALEEASRPKVALLVTTSPMYPTRFERI